MFFKPGSMLRAKRFVSISWLSARRASCSVCALVFRAHFSRRSLLLNTALVSRFRDLHSARHVSAVFAITFPSSPAEESVKTTSARKLRAAVKNAVRYRVSAIVATRIILMGFARMACVRIKGWCRNSIRSSMEVYVLPRATIAKNTHVISENAQVSEKRKKAGAVNAITMSFAVRRSWKPITRLQSKKRRSERSWSVRRKSVSARRKIAVEIVGTIVTIYSNYRTCKFLNYSYIFEKKQKKEKKPRLNISPFINKGFILSLGFFSFYKWDQVSLITFVTKYRLILRSLRSLDRCKA